MKNRLVNKKVVSSVGIGIMAFVTATSPVLTVLAEDNEPGDTVEPSVEQPNEPALPGESQNAKVSEAISGNEGAQAAIGDAQDIIAEEQEKAAEGETVSDDSVSENLEEADTALGDLDAEIKELDAANKDAAEKAEEWKESLNAAVNEEGKGWLDNLSDDTSEAEKAAGGLKDVINNDTAAAAEEKAQEAEAAQKVTYENAEAAQTAKDQANTTATEAEAIRDQAQAAYDEAEEKLQIAEKNCETAEELWEAAEERYKEAVDAVEKAKAELEKILKDNGIDAGKLEEEDLDSDQFKGNVKIALEKAQAALEKAQSDQEKAEEGLKKAEKVKEAADGALSAAQAEMEKVEQDLVDLEFAEGVLQDAKDKEAGWQSASDTLDRTSEELQNAETLRDQAQADAALAIEELKKAQQDLLAGEAREQQSESEKADKAYEEAKEAVDKAPNKEDKQAAWEKEKEAREAFVSSMNKQAETQIKYQLQKMGLVEDVDDVEFSSWVSSRGDNNYVLVSYKDKEGNVCHEYYDYKEEANGNITVVKKEPADEKVYLNANGTSFTAKEDEDGNQQFLMGSQELPAGSQVVGSPEGGYTVIIPGETGNSWVNTYHPYALRALVSIEVTRIELNGVTTYFVDGEEAKIEFYSDGKTINKINGTAVMIKAGDLGWKKTDNNQPVEIFFGPTFSGKGESCNISMPDTDKSLDDLRTSASTAKEDKIEKDKALSAAETEVSQKEAALNTALNDAKTKLDEAEVDIAGNTDEEKTAAIKEAVAAQLSEAKSVTERAESVVASIEAPYKEKAGEKSVKDFLDELKSGWPKRQDELKRAIAEADAVVKVKGDVKTAANTILESVGLANNKVIAAVKKLADLSAQEGVNEAEYAAAKAVYDKAVQDCLDAAAAKGASEADLNRIVIAAQRARAAADAQFAYNTLDTTPGGTVDSGTTDGGMTGGGTADGGTTGGGTADGGTTGGGTTGDGAGTPAAAPVVTIPTATVPLAGPGAAVENGTLADAGEDGTAGLTTLEDEATPLAGPEDKTEEVDLEDVPTPLAGPTAEKGQMSWWWLLIIAVLGVTGEEMYRRHQKKRKEANIEN